MRAWWLAFCVGMYEQRFALLALAITIAAWLAVTYVIPDKYMNVIVYALVGWYWLGAVVVPWVERKIQKLFR